MVQPISSEDLNRNTVHRRAVEAAIWGIPAVNYDRMYQAMVGAAHGQFNQILYWTHPSDWKNQTLTPNTDALYLMPFFNTKDVGPMVLEIPPARGDSRIVGTVMDCWQTPLEDVGPAGVDKGKGGKYLILPPGYKEKVPAGYIPLPSTTYAGYALLRSIPKSGSEADIATAVGYGRQIKLYPLSAAAHPPDTIFDDATNVVIDGTIPYDMRFYESLHRMVQAEPRLERDKVMIDQLKSIGIEKGRPFQPDTDTAATLRSAVTEAHQWFDLRYESAYPPYYPGEHYFFPADPAMMEDMATGFANPDRYPVDARGLLYYYVFTSIKHPGAGQFYLFNTKDKAGQPLDGAKTYHLAVPAHVPVHQYWSATAYDYATHALIRDVPYGSRSSLTPGIQINPDGSAELYFGPKAPDGKDSNWIPTKAGGKFELIFRLYGPDKPLFDKTWVLPDLEEVK
jgi:hypothetical protein